ncbi:hypothetical protein HUK80_15455 [Flavobacterium sp. MAH-1]|uniref:Uncharacterized protein n=1 Tax=Flavobacterium agri TaxID=2743471 RepID=A0A7Y8Y4P9_9FLAO|nr:hypothetical protein [Flavobacterium agri]NUY82301.1 hypothetical protein [Flavobacterium agri]NYA72325.1 hypothetical protein [Flavobacterium agri]
MQSNNIFRIGTAYDLTKVVGSSYFIALALANGIGMLINSKFGIFDFLLLIAVAMPLVINRNWFYQFFGFTNVLLWLVLAVAVVSKIRVMETTDFLIGLGLSLSSIAFGLVLIYSGMYGQSRN